MPYTDEQLETAFNNFDKDGSGAIVKNEVVNVLKGMGLPDEDAAKIAQNCMEDGDEDGNNKMTLQEFKDFMNSQ